MSYDPYEALIAPARAKASLLRLILGLVITTLLYMLLLSLSCQVLLSVMGEAWFEQTLQVPGPSSPSQMFVMLGSFGFLTAAVSFTVWSLHHHSPLLLIGDFARAKAQFFRTMIRLFALATVVAVITSNSSTVVQNLPLSQWLGLLPLSLAFLLIQVSAEELVFRGYLQSQLAALGLHRIVWIVIPSAIFGLLHYDPAVMGAAAPWMVLSTTLFGVIAADLTARSGTLGPAIAFHFVWNFYSIIFCGFSDYLGGLALFSYDFSITDEERLISLVPYDAAFLLLAYLTMRIALRRLVAIWPVDD
ncbi:MAG: CPBP family intramembrane metalloprotease [Planktomarina sp.]|uniref:CPBP family intramembrane glutamic endopeptidase n=1 Tax=Planktomarina sp. TaxID=2024851 RepID=UPI0032605BF0|nr:CPBP family intramembrane metalloprotease [Planktomarina sp.]